VFASLLGYRVTAGSGKSLKNRFLRSLEIILKTPFGFESFGI